MSLYEVDTIKIEKEKAMQRYRRFKKIANVATTLQFCFAFLFFSWLISRSSAYFPAGVELCRFVLRRLCMIVVNHHFGFLLGNLIIITLFVKSGHSSCNNRKSYAVAGNDDDGFLIRQFVPPHQKVSCEIVTEEAPSDEKDIVPAETMVAVPSPAEIEDLAVQRTEAEPEIYRRTRSEEFQPKVTGTIQLGRSETEPRREMESSGEDSTGRRRMQVVEDLSNEEFQRKVEAFIERQQRFLREESLSMALPNRCSA